MPCEDPRPAGPAPPDLVIVEGPGGVKQMGISPDSVFAAMKQHQPLLSGFRPPPQMPPAAPGSPPMLASAPPALRRQNASRFSWPPDAAQEWCYIGLSPAELAEQCGRVLSRITTAREVAEFFMAPEAAESRAYCNYAARYREELDALLSQ